MEAQKQGLTVFIDTNGEPKAVIYRSKSGEWLIYTLVKAGEDEITELVVSKDKII